MVLLSFEDPLETRHYINGSFVPSINGKKIITINPATEELIAEVHAADEDDVNVAVESARQAFKPGSPWREMDATGRRDCMLKLADAMEKNRSYLAKLESMNNGKPEHIQTLQI
jgi:aldehyde dehydrogenase (NAD+)